jgi:cellulose synthase/poly-beta-1,6-N-acetylglucosamine synthase-like glycosyltransferase
LENPDLGGVCGIRVGGKDIEGGFRNLQVIQQKAESEIDSIIVAHGSLEAFRKDLMSPIDPTSFGDDPELVMKVRRKGRRVVLDTSITTYEPYEKRPLRRLKQRSRRAGGVVRVLLENLDLLWSNMDWRFSYVVYPINLLTLVFLPWALLFGVCAALGLLLSVSIPLATVGVVLTLLVLAGYILGRPKTIAGLLDIAVSCAIGQLDLLKGKPQHIWEKASIDE